MSIAALAALPVVGQLASAAIPMAGQALRAVTQIASHLAKSMGDALNQNNHNKIAHENSHGSRGPVNFSPANSANKSVNINIS